MSGTERYIRQATRGLSGQARTDAQMELRGAIEDKAWRLTLLGLEPQEASQAALRDLGSPHAIASGLTRVHTLPKAALGAVLAGVATLLGVQALAQVPTVRAIQDPTWVKNSSCVFDEVYLKRLTSENATTLREAMAQPGGRAKLEAGCRADRAALPNDLLRLSDVEAALTAGGIKVEHLTNQPNSIDLTLPGWKDGRTLDFMYGVQKIGKEPYVATSRLIDSLLSIEKIPLKLTGIVNPVLEIGSAKLQLGTVNASVHTADIYTNMIMEKSRTDLMKGTPSYIQVYGVYGGDRSPQPLNINAADGSFYTLIFNWKGAQDKYYVRVDAVHSGQILNPVIGLNNETAPLVSTPEELLAATTKKQPALLVYKLDTSDLRNLKLTPVPASQIKVLPAR
jgi:hypothetical protein